MKRCLTLFAVLWIGCDSSTPADEAHRTGPEPEPEAEAPPARCGADDAWQGGEILRMPDGAEIYYRVAGPSDAPPVLYVHGGPGYNAYSFEHTAGPVLERSLRMVYVDQRGSGRSAGGPASLALGMDPTVDDLERLRTHLAIQRWSLIAHSFGGVVALVYASRHPDAVDKLVMVETSGDVPASLENQVQTLAQGGAPGVAEIAIEGRPVADRLMQMYTTLGRETAQRRLEWASDAAQHAGERWDRVSRLGECGREGVLPAYRNAGWLDAHPELMQPTGHPTLLIVGRGSHVLGDALVARTAQAWSAPTMWMEQSGHFPFIDEPDRFASVVIDFVNPPANDAINGRGRHPRLP